MINRSPRLLKWWLGWQNTSKLWRKYSVHSKMYPPPPIAKSWREHWCRHVPFTLTWFLCLSIFTNFVQWQAGNHTSEHTFILVTISQNGALLLLWRRWLHVLQRLLHNSIKKWPWLPYNLQKKTDTYTGHSSLLLFIPHDSCITVFFL